MAGGELMRPHTSAHEDQGRPKKECVDRWIIVKLLPLVRRSSQSDSNDGVSNRKRRRKSSPKKVAENFSDKGLTTVEGFGASHDEGRVAGMRHNH